MALLQKEWRIEEGLFSPRDGKIVSWRNWDSFDDFEMAKKFYGKCRLRAKRLVEVLVLSEEEHHD